MNVNHESLDVSMGTANMVGALLSTMTFGVHLALFSDLNRLYFGRMGRRQRWRPSRHDWQLLAYVYVLLLLSATGLCLQAWANHDAFVIHGTYPGGPLAYLAQRAHQPIHVAVTSIYIVVNCFINATLMYRAYVLSKYRTSVVTACTLSCMALVGMGGYLIHSIAMDGVNLWMSCELTPCIAYLTLSFGINFVFTVGIIWRICYIRWELGGVLGQEVTRLYTSIAAMLIESASLYTVVSLLAIIACARGIPMQGALLPMLGQLQAISPIMVAYRVMSGRVVTPETWSQLVFFETFRRTSLTDSPVNTDFDASPFTRLSQTDLSPLNDMNHKFTNPASKRLSLRLFTELSPLSAWDDGEEGYEKTLPYEDNDSSPSGERNIAFLPPSPQTAPIALAPLNSTMKHLSRPLWMRC